MYPAVLLLPHTSVTISATTSRFLQLCHHESAEESRYSGQCCPKSSLPEIEGGIDMARTNTYGLTDRQFK